MSRMGIKSQIIHPRIPWPHASPAIGLFFLLSCFSGVEAAEFIRGDGNEDGTIDISDPVFNLENQFLGLHDPRCEAALDTNADGEVDISDPVYNLEHQFLGRPAPPPPYPTCGPDPSLDRLDCESHAACEPPTIEGFTVMGLNEQGYPEYTHDQTGIVFVLLPGGTFWMGAQADDPEGPNYDPYAESLESPVHEVTLSPFLLATYELTQGQWLEVMGENPSYFQPGQDGEPSLPPELLGNEAWLELPVETVSWIDIQLFEEATGLTLPTEAQWEYAARAGTSTLFSFGAVDTCDVWSCEACPAADPFMWYCASSDAGLGRRTHKVGTKQPNAYGLHDMHGNLQEWCEDAWDWGFYARPEAAGPDPVSISVTPYEVVRGGDWLTLARHCRSAIRRSFSRYDRHYNLGLRLSYWPLPSGL